MSKQSSYQKLKEENQRLMRDIYNLVINAKTSEGIETAIKYEIMFMQEKVLWGIVENSLKEANLVSRETVA